MVKDWDSVRDEIHRLYKVTNLPLREVMRLVKGKTGFTASERSYRTQLLKWGYTKYSTEAHPKPNRMLRSGKDPVSHHVAPRSSNNVFVQNATSGSSGLPGFAEISGMGNNRDAMYSGASSSASTAGGLPFMSFEHQLGGPSAFDLSTQLPTAGKTQLYQAIVTENVDSIKALLFSGVAVSVKDNLGNEPLHSAVLTGRVEIVELLLRFGADPNAKGALDRSPLHLAVSDSKTADVLLKHGAEPSDQDENGDTPLHLALPTIPTRLEEKPSVVDALVKAGCDVNRPNKAGVTPFLKLLAAPHEGYGFYELVIFFLERGGSVNTPLPDGRTPFQLFLVRSGDRWATWFLREHIGANAAFHSFLDKGVPIETATTSSGEPLVLDFFKKARSFEFTPDLKLAKIFCERVDPNADLGRANTLLHKVLGSHTWHKGEDMEPLVELLLQRGANASRQNLDGQTPLAVLFETPRLERVTERIVQMLLDKDAEVSQRVILKAARRFPKNEKILRQLLQNYALQLGSRQGTSESHVEAAEQRWWDDWVHAARACEWTSLKQLLSQSNMRTYPKAGPKFAVTALAVLVGTHIEALKNVVQENPAEKERQREHVAEVLRFCRSQELPVDMACFDCLIELCL